jgi:Formyl transferase
MAIERAFEEFKTGRLTRTGIMVHYVIDEVDRGAPIMVKEIEWEGEELEELKERMHFHEHELIVKATAKVAQEIVEGRERKPRDVPKSLSCKVYVTATTFIMKLTCPLSLATSKWVLRLSIRTNQSD